MGRKTWSSIPKNFKPLKGRYNIVLSRTVNLIDGPDAIVSSLEDLIVLLDSDSWKKKIHQVFNGGGSEIYKVGYLVGFYLLCVVGIRNFCFGNIS